MTTPNELQHGVPNTSIGKRALQGAGIALVPVTIFLSIIFPIGGVLVGKTFWRVAWEFLPLVNVAVGGALGGIVYSLMVQVRLPRGWKKVLATIFRIMIYLVLLWFTMIVGFSVTSQWD